MKFKGYRRSDGRVGVRNHVVVMPGVTCAAVAAKKIAATVPGAVYMHNPNGCAQTPRDTAITLNILSGMIANGNVYGALIVGLGCETIQEEMYVEAVAQKTDKPLHYIALQKSGGLKGTVDSGVKIVQELIQGAEICRRVDCDLSDLILGLECGGSDPTSGFSANSVLGAASDAVVDSGGTAVLTETPEAIGAEHILRERGATPEVGQRIYDAVKNNEKLFLDLGMDVRSANPSPGNKASGITTLEEKSLGCIHKAGARPFTESYSYGDMIDKKGLMFMDTTAYDVCSTVAKVAGGAQVVVFTTGMGTPVGTAVAPVIKMTGNRDTYKNLEDILDFDSSASIYGEKTTEELGGELLEYILRVASGERVKAEINEAFDMAINQFASYC
ncbi:carbohydrate hydrolase [Synergistales bacterium]|nr:carbohydrate hydrolase [Synergistales bacterium]